MVGSRIETGLASSADVLQHLSGLVDAIGTSDLERRLTCLVSKCLSIEELIVSRHSASGAAAEIIFSHGPERRNAGRAPRNLPDPLHGMPDKRAPDGIYALQFHSKDGLKDASQARCNARARQPESRTLFQVANGTAIAISLFGTAPSYKTPSTASDQFGLIGSILLPIVSLHVRLTRPAARSTATGDMETCVSRAFPELTPREVAVCARSILGTTAEGIALELGIKQTSVLTYRQRAYARLEINSINQLSTRLIYSSTSRQLALSAANTGSSNGMSRAPSRTPRAARN